MDLRIFRPPVGFLNVWQLDACVTARQTPCWRTPGWVIAPTVTTAPTSGHPAMILMHGHPSAVKEWALAVVRGSHPVGGRSLAGEPGARGAPAQSCVPAPRNFGNAHEELPNSSIE
jgi:hypothetical protein